LNCLIHFKLPSRLLRCFVGLLFLIPGTIRAEVLEAGFSNFHPFMISESNSGIYHNILLSIANITGDTFNITYFPTSRGLREFEKGTIDVVIGENPVWRKGSEVPGVYTIAFAEQVDVILFRPGKRIPVTSAKSLQGRTVGAVRGYYYPGYMADFLNDSITRVDLRDEHNLLKFLDGGRVDQIFINKAVAQYWMHKKPSYRNYEIGNDIGRADIMIRVHPSKMRILERTNKAIKQLVLSGEIDKIYQQYRQH